MSCGERRFASGIIKLWIIMVRKDACAVAVCKYLSPLVAHHLSSLRSVHHLRHHICFLCVEFNREIVSVSMSYLDRFLATRSVNRRIFQLAAMTALYIAIKLYENGNFAISSVTSLSRGYFVSEHIVAMEEIMLKALKWHVHPPTPIAFCRDFMLLISMDIPPEMRLEINELVRYLTELSVCDYWFVSRKPSTIAIAAFVCAFEVLGYQRIESRYQDDFLQRLVDHGNSTATDEDIDECCDRLRDIFRTNAANNDEEAEETNETRVAVVTPVRELDDAAPRAKRAESPNSVIIMNQSRSRKRKVLSSVRFQAVSADSNFNEDADEQADDVPQ